MSIKYIAATAAIGIALLFCAVIAYLHRFYYLAGVMVIGAPTLLMFAFDAWRLRSKRAREHMRVE